MENVKDKVERLKVKAEDFLSRDIQIFIRTYDKDYFFECDILIIGDKYITIYCNSGKHIGKHILNWFDVDTLKEQEDEGDEI